jgi:hypothetical protein
VAVLSVVIPRASSFNTATGLSVLFSNTTGFNNTAGGVQALVFNTIGFNNTATEVQALLHNTTGNDRCERFPISFIAADFLLPSVSHSCQ